MTCCTIFLIIVVIGIKLGNFVSHFFLKDEVNFYFRVNNYRYSTVKAYGSCTNRYVPLYMTPLFTHIPKRLILFFFKFLDF